MTEKKRRSPETDIVRFFSDAEPVVALTVYRIVRGILAQRGVFTERAKEGPSRVVARRSVAEPRTETS